ncbi:MAG: hypothetical protein ACI93R_001908 [Flavobacteriales bacterium]|jgi:hypothetical protein
MGICRGYGATTWIYTTHVTRRVTAEENSLYVLMMYERKGYKPAKARIASLMESGGSNINRHLLAMDVIVALMQYDLAKSVDLIRLLAPEKSI